jgi:hypothetical protein
MSTPQSDKLDQMFDKYRMAYAHEGERVVDELMLKQALQDYIAAEIDEVIGKNDKPNTFVPRYPGRLAPGVKKSTKLSDNEKSRKALRTEQRKRAVEKGYKVEG